MTEQNPAVASLAQRRAIEALRAGVPNRAVAAQLPPHDLSLVKRYETLLRGTESGWLKDDQPSGILLSGNFGAGKTHWLEYFRHVALENGFVCSTVVLSKETPLHDLLKVYRAAVGSAEAPGKTGPALDEIAQTYSADRAPHHASLYRWVHENSNLDARFAASLFLFERNTDLDLRQRLLAEWNGYPLKIGEFREGLTAIGARGAYKIGRALRGQTIQRFQFLSRFFIAAGYNGWALLVDETEMVSRYTLRQRARAYANLAWLLGVAPGRSIPGLASVFTITSDYSSQVLYGRRQDAEIIPARLRSSPESELLTPAKKGMEFIDKWAVELYAPNRSRLEAIFERAREIYRAAYQWDPPDLRELREYASSTSIRQYLRLWVNSWDLRRLYGYEGNSLIEEIKIRYEEDPDLQEDTSDTGMDEENVGTREVDESPYFTF